MSITTKQNSPADENCLNFLLYKTPLFLQGFFTLSLLTFCLVSIANMQQSRKAYHLLYHSILTQKNIFLFSYTFIFFANRIRNWDNNHLYFFKSVCYLMVTISGDPSRSRQVPAAIMHLERFGNNYDKTGSNNTINREKSAAAAIFL